MDYDSLPADVAWDPHKAESNYDKHGVRFETAIRVLANPSSLFLPPELVNGEVRQCAIGSIDEIVVLFVVFTLRQDDEGNQFIRLISARRASRKERYYYEHRPR